MSQTIDQLTDTFEAAVTRLRAAGWTCIPPVDPSAEVPAPKIGEVWISTNARVEPRTIVAIGPHRAYPWAGDKCVFFTTPRRPPHPKWGATSLTPDAWRSWARESQARPERPVADEAQK